MANKYRPFSSRRTAMRSQPGGMQNTSFSTSPICEEPEESLLLGTEFKFIEAEKNQTKQEADIKKKLIKVRHDIEVGKVYDYIINKWKLKQPKLIVSITDVPQNFRMKEWHTTFLKRLIEIAVDTGAWIITGGTNYGVTKHVGKAVQKFFETRKSLNEAENVVVIGITAWGAIHDRQKIFEEKQTMDLFGMFIIVSITGGARDFKKKSWHTRFIKHLVHIAVDAVSESLRWMMQAMQDNNTVPKNLKQIVHVKALKSPYPQSNADRFHVPEILVSWTISMGSYKPKFYTSKNVAIKPPWADPPLEDIVVNLRPQFNTYDSHYKVDRRSHMGKYLIVNNLPRNPIGRTGIWGRGLLGRYGPNYAVNPIVTRWVKEDNGNDLEIEGKRVLEFIAIQREDTGHWAIPGGMVHPGETITETLLRKFEEEVKYKIRGMEHEELRKKLKTFLEKNDTEVFRDYADDHRNTDNSWIESVVMNCHDENGKVLGDLIVSPGVDAKGAEWKQIEKSLELFASHEDYIKKVAGMRKAYFQPSETKEERFLMNDLT